MGNEGFFTYFIVSFFLLIGIVIPKDMVMYSINITNLMPKEGKIFHLNLIYLNLEC